MYTVTRTIALFVFSLFILFPEAHADGRDPAVRFIENAVKRGEKGATTDELLGLFHIEQLARRSFPAAAKKNRFYTRSWERISPSEKKAHIGRTKKQVRWMINEIRKRNGKGRVEVSKRVRKRGKLFILNGKGIFHDKKREPIDLSWTLLYEAGRFLIVDLTAMGLQLSRNIPGPEKEVSR